MTGGAEYAFLPSLAASPVAKRASRKDATMRSRTAPVLVVAGGNHVTVLVNATETGGVFDVIEVLARPGGGPPAHQHEFVEWFHVLEGELQLCG